MSPVPRIVAPIGLPLLTVVSGMMLGWHFPQAKNCFFLGLGVGTTAALILFCLSRRLVWRILPMLVPILFLSALRTGVRLCPEFPLNHLVHQATGRAVLLEGILYDQPRVYRTFTCLPFEATRLRSPQGCREAVGRADLFLAAEARDLRVGDVLLVEASIRKPREMGNPGEADNKRRSFLNRVYVKGTIRDREHIVRVGVAKGYGPQRRIEEVRARLAQFLNSVDGPEPRGLMKAWFLGDRAELPQETVQAFRSSGLAHLLAISGLHVGLVGMLAYGAFKLLLKRSSLFLLRFSVRKTAVFGSLPFVIGYVLLAGSPVTAVRAAAMATLLAGALLLDRVHALWNALGLAALLILAGDPSSLFSASFWLSFAAVTALLAARPLWRAESPGGYSSRGRPRSALVRRTKQAVRQLFVVSVTATLATAPLTAYFFNQVTPLGVLANMVVVPLVGWFVIPVGLASVLMYLISAPGAYLFLHLAGLGAQLTFQTAQVFSCIPGACIRTGTPDFMELVLFYLALALLLIQGMAVWKKAALLLVAVVLTGLLGVDILEPRLSRQLKITFLSVGNGDSILIEFPGGERMIVDGGLARDGFYDTGRRIVAPFLGQKNICRVDYLVASHGQADHYGGLRYVAEQFQPRELWVGPMTGEEEAGYRGFLDLCEQQGVRVSEKCRQKDQFSLGGVDVEILHPPCRDEADFPRLVNGGGGVVNNGSLVIRLTHGSVSFLLTGDMEKEAERMLAENGAGLEALCLKVAHHGSRSSSSAAFLDAVNPRVAVISAGYRNRFGFPSDVVVNRLQTREVALFRTDLDGAITVESDGKGVRVSSFRGRGEEHVMAATR